MEPTEPLEGIRAPDADDESGAPARGTRRRQGAGAAAGALVVAAALVAITLPDNDPDAAPDRDPRQPTSTPSPSDYVKRSSAELIANPQTRLRDVGIAEDGTVAAVWESPDGTSQALAVDRADGSTYVTDPGQVLFSVTPTPGGMLALREDYYKVGILRLVRRHGPGLGERRTRGPGAG